MAVASSHPPPEGAARRILAIWCARLAIDRWHLLSGNSADGPEQAAVADPVALILDSAHGPRITATNRSAQALGIRIGSMLADARALAPHLLTHPADPAGDLAFLEEMAVWAQRWGPWSALDPPDGALVDISGAAHLFGGEERLLDEAARVFAARGVTARLAIAPTAGAAWALAHHGPPLAIVGPDDDLSARLSQLPVAALRLDDDVITVLRRLGIKRLGELHTIGRKAIVRRFRNRRSAAANPLLRYDQMLGKVPEPLLPVAAPKVPMVQRRLVEPIRHLPLLETVLADLAADMMRLLEGGGVGARRLELGCWRVDGALVVRELELSTATRDDAHVCRLFSEKLDGIEAGFGFEMVRLTARWTEPLGFSQGMLDAAAQEHGTSLAACIDRLSTRLGGKSVRRPVAYASHVPERAQRWQAPLDPAPQQGELAFHSRPLKMLDRAEPIAVVYATPEGPPRRFRWRGSVHEVTRVEGPERIAPEWWREHSKTRLRDYYRIEDSEGRRFWIYRLGLAGDGRGGAPDWYLQGLYS